MTWRSDRSEVSEPFSFCFVLFVLFYSVFVMFSDHFHLSVHPNEERSDAPQRPGAGCSFIQISAGRISASFETRRITAALILRSRPHFDSNGRRFFGVSKDEREKKKHTFSRKKNFLLQKILIFKSAYDADPRDSSNYHSRRRVLQISRGTLNGKAEVSGFRYNDGNDFHEAESNVEKIPYITVRVSLLPLSLIHI